MLLIYLPSWIKAKLDVSWLLRVYTGYVIVFQHFQHFQHFLIFFSANLNYSMNFKLSQSFLARFGVRSSNVCVLSNT